MPDLSKIIASRHRDYTTHAARWQYFSDAYAADPTWPTMVNPLHVGWSLANGRTSGNRYVYQFALEDGAEYQNRLNKAVYVDVVSPAVDLYSATVGQPNSVVANIPPDYADLWDNADLQGTSFLQFMLSARTQACVFGHVYVLVDSPRAKAEIRTEADVQAQGIRPFVRLVKPTDLLNWRLDENGAALEVLFRVPVEAPGSILDAAAETDQAYEYRYWSQTKWQVIRQDGETYTVADEGENPIGEVPIVPLYHKRISAFQGDSLIKMAAKYGQLLSNWVSSIDSIQEKQSFAQPCLRAEAGPATLAVGAAKVLHLKPQRKDNSTGEIVGEEDFFFRAPDVAPVAAMWDSFTRVLQLANKSMGLQPDVSEDKATPESGVARAWKWHDTERRMIMMAQNEEAAARKIFNLAAKWKGQQEFPGSISYSTKFDLSALESDVERMIGLQTVGVPPTARKEMTRQILSKALPSVAPEVQKQIDTELERMGTMPMMTPARQEA